MQQRDILKDQIEQLGQALGKLISKFLKLDSNGDITSHIEITNQQLKNELDIDLDKLVEFNQNELKGFIEEKNFTAEHLELLSEYLTKIGMHKTNSKKDNANAYLTRAIDLLECANDISQMISFDRIRQIKEIKNLL